MQIYRLIFAGFLLGLALVAIGSGFSFRERFRRWGYGMIAGGTVLIGAVAVVNRSQPVSAFLVAPETATIAIDSTYHYAEAVIGDCLSLYRVVGPLWLVSGFDNYPGDSWDKSPPGPCRAVGYVGGSVRLPDRVAVGSWGLCDRSVCYELEPSGTTSRVP